VATHAASPVRRFMISPLLECALAVDCFLEALVNLFEQD